MPLVDLLLQNGVITYNFDILPFAMKISTSYNSL